MKKIWLKFGICLSVILFGLFWIKSNKVDTTSNLATPPHIKDHLPPQQENLASNQDMTEKTEPENLSSQVEDTLLKYAEFSKYPPNSQPILSEAHIHTFLNSSLPQSSLPFPFDDLDMPIEVSIELNQNNYFYGDTILAKVDISQTPEHASISTRAVLMSLDGNTIADSTTQEDKDGITIITFDTQAYSSKDWPIEMNVGAYIDVNGHPIFISAPFKINDETASLESVGFSEPVGENLLIPLNLDVKLAGYYYLAAILYSSSTHLPLIHLETEGLLSEGLGLLNLKAHIQALKKEAMKAPTI